MSDFVPNNRDLREVLILFFHSKKTSAEAHRELQKVYGDAVPRKTTRHDWLCRFKDGDFDIVSICIICIFNLQTLPILSAKFTGFYL